MNYSTRLYRTPDVPIFVGKVSNFVAINSELDVDYLTAPSRSQTSPVQKNSFSRPKLIQNFHSLYTEVFRVSRSGVVSTAARVRAGGSGFRILVGERHFSSKRRDRLRGPLGLLFSGYQFFFWR